MKTETGNWTEFRTRFGLLPGDEIDFHHGPRGLGVSYDEMMRDIENNVLTVLQRAFQQQRPYVMFTHGWSTSVSGKTTARSVVRGVMRSKHATPYIDRSNCIQHQSVFVAKIKRRQGIASGWRPGTLAGGGGPGEQGAASPAVSPLSAKS
jgi:hypothetical protein